MTALTLAQMHALLPDNNTGLISAEDMRDIVESLYNPSRSPLEAAPVYTDAGMSDEFESGTLDAQWTVVGAVSGTVSMVTPNPSDSVYDLTSLPGTMLVQVKPGDRCHLRVDDFLSDGEQVIAAISIASPGDAPQVNNSMWAGIGFNDDNTDAFAGNDGELSWDGSDDPEMFFGVNSAGTTIGTFNPGTPLHNRAYYRFVRAGGVVYAWLSIDGVSWSSLGGTSTNVSTANNFWLFFDSLTVAYDHAPIAAVHWVRHVANNNYMPW